MKELFHIQNGSPENVPLILSLKPGENNISFAISGKTGNELYELAYCSINECCENTMTSLFSGYLSKHHSFYQVEVAYDISQSMLIPAAVYVESDSDVHLKTIDGNPANSFLIAELIPEWQMYIVYWVPSDVHIWISQKFPNASYRHRFSLAVKKMNAAGDNGHLAVDFGTGEFTLLAAKSSKLMLAQTFPYKTPDDVIYYLLKTCRQFLCSPKEVKLQLSGLIEKRSSLYKELYQYFFNIDFRESGWKTGNEYPAHFFTTLNDLAQCAS
ncbi:MAG: DUF3822 family protein [Chitinophagaceae bacterium]